MAQSDYGTAEPFAAEAELAACMEIIRAYLGDWGYHKHMLSGFEYVRACAVADAIEDADLAVHDYLGLDANENLDLGELYLQTYGVLQAAYVQQDAVAALRKIVGLSGSLRDIPTMARLRDIRNRAVGHPSSDAPTRRNRREAAFIIRASLRIGYFEMMRAAPEGDEAREGIHVKDLLIENRRAIVEWLRELARFVNRIEYEHRLQLAEQGQLSTLLHPSWDYLIQGLLEAGLGYDKHRVLKAQTHAKCLSDILARLKDDLNKRGLQERTEFFLARPAKALSRITDLLTSEYNEDTQIDLQAHAMLLEKDFSSIVDLLSEIDQQFGQSSSSQ